MNVSVVIPNLNGRNLLERNLPELLKAADSKKNNISEIIIVDDGSWDDSVSYLQKNYKQIKLVKHTRNRGFSAAVNTGVRSSKGDLILLLNTDVIPVRNFLEPVLPHFDNPKVFAVSLHEKGYGWAIGMFNDGFIELKPGPEGKTVHNSFYVSGGSGIFRKSIWKELGGMDEVLLSPFYWEDIDICYRAAKRGYLNLWEPKGMVIHEHESTISKLPKKYVQRIREKNQLLMLWKNIHSRSLMRKHISGLVRRIGRHPGYIRIFLMTLPSWSNMQARRRKERRESRVSDEAVFAQFA